MAPILAVGSLNSAKIQSALSTGIRIFGEETTVVGVEVVSCVDDQPKSASETRAGAIHRAREALSVTPGADFGVGMEGGIELVGEEWFECGWMAVVSKDGKLGLGTSARVRVGKTIVKRLLEGEELSDVIDDMTGKTDIRSGMGFMGIVTAGHLPRADCYAHGLIYAFSPFLSDEKYWI